MQNDEKILILDTGDGNGASIARKLRMEGYYAEVEPVRSAAGDDGASGILITGSACDVNLPSWVAEARVPVLAIGNCAAALLLCYGAQLIYLKKCETDIRVNFSRDVLFEDLSFSDRYIDKLPVIRKPEDFDTIGESEDGSGFAFADSTRRRYALLFGPEPNDPDGMQILVNFCRTVCGMNGTWSIESFYDRAIDSIRAKVGDGTAFVTISGGVDSAVCAVLMHKAIGNRLTCLYVDTGLMRKGEPERVRRVFGEEIGITLKCVDASERFMQALQGRIDIDHKRMAVEEVMEEVYHDQTDLFENSDFRAKGTIYEDILQYGDAQDDDQSICPVRDLFKFEVRELGELMGMPYELLHQPPFPAAGLAVRCIGEVTAYKIGLLREADDIFCSELISAGQNRRCGQYFALLTDMKTRCAPPDHDRAGYAVVLRAVSGNGSAEQNAMRLPYDLLERVSARISHEVKGINRILYEISSTPPSTIEWE